ncbi:MAG: hypothetical protein WCK47_10300 [bacterium]|nr:hypothetical protein [Candidatus Sumerlaeota bacterium]
MSALLCASASSASDSQTSATAETSAPVAMNFASHPIVAQADAASSEAQSLDDGMVASDKPLPMDWNKSYPRKWDCDEFAQLSALAAGSTDPLAILPEGSVLGPTHPLSAEELLAANREETPITYREAAQASSPDKPVAIGPLPPGQIEVESADYLDYDEERHFVYGNGRITARYGPYKITSDRMMIDTRLREIQAQGRVIITSDVEYVEAESMWVSALTGQGVAYNTKGRVGPLYFLGDPFADQGRTNFRQLGRSEAHFKDASFTTCDFPVPHYRIHAKEFSIYRNERVFARNVIVYVAETPVLWLPYFTRNLKDNYPWEFEFGFDDESLGNYLRTFYNYYYSYYTPSDVDPNTMERVSFAKIVAKTDYFSRRGWGFGLNANYNLDRGLNRGSLTIYGIDDTNRHVTNDAEQERFYVNMFHRTKITDELQWLIDADYPSDPDLFYDIFDRLKRSNEWRRERFMERHALTGLEWTSEDFFAGLQIAIKDRIGRDRVSLYADPRDADWDFDRRLNDEYMMRVTPGGMTNGWFPTADGTMTDPFSISNYPELGIASKRYGRVMEKMPQLTISSNRMRLWTLPLWYHLDLNVFNNLDKGLNVVGTRDDSYVRGFDLYQSISHLLKFNERYTLLTKVGVGVGIAERDDKSYNLKFPNNAQFPYVYNAQSIEGTTEGLVFLDKDTFLVGRKQMSLKDVQSEFGYADIDSKFNARLTDELNFYVRYRYREGSKHSLGQFYEDIGARKTMDDLYAFRTRENWIETGMNYIILDPHFSANAAVGKNLQGTGDITPYETLNYSNLSGNWSNFKNTLFLNSGVTRQERQMRDPTDPYQFQQETTTYFTSGAYSPVHKRYYARGAAFLIQNSGGDPLYPSTANDIEIRNESVFSCTLGKKLGTKYLVEYSAYHRNRDQGYTDNYIRLERDFHDLVGTLSFVIRNREQDYNDSGSGSNDNYQVKFQVRFKASTNNGLMPYEKTTNLYNAGKIGAFETGG